MLLFDVNIFIYAFRSELPQHDQMRRWLESTINGNETVGISELVLSAFIRITTNQRAFNEPSEMTETLHVAQVLLDHPNTMVIQPTSAHWKLFAEFCALPRIRGNLVTDAYLAALAVENNCEWITTDRDFAQFPGLRWRHPLT